MRMLSAIKPTPIPDLAEWELDRLEILSCGATKADTSCLLVRYFNFEANNIEGDHFYLSLNETLEDAAKTYGVPLSSWVVPNKSDLKDTEEMYRIVRSEHIANLAASGKLP